MTIECDCWCHEYQTIACSRCAEAPEHRKQLSVPRAPTTLREAMYESAMSMAFPDVSYAPTQGDHMTETVDLTPQFVYTEPVEIVARFLTELTRVASKREEPTLEALTDVINGVKGVGLFAAREAMREILTQDIELQIANKTFPLPKRVR